MIKHHFWLKLSKSQWLRYYKGASNTVMVHSLKGVKIAIPAHHFRSHTTFNGIEGFFELILDNDNKLVSLKRISGGTSLRQI
ncbi:MAG: DUF2835 family protein [Myxococcota bacterium]